MLVADLDKETTAAEVEEKNSQEAYHGRRGEDEKKEHCSGQLDLSEHKKSDEDHIVTGLNRNEPPVEAPGGIAVTEISARFAEADKHRQDKITPTPKPETFGVYSKKQEELQVKDTRIAKGGCKEGHVAGSQYEGLYTKPEQLKWVEIRQRILENLELMATIRLTVKGTEFVNHPLLRIDIPGNSCQGLTATDVDAEGEHGKGLVVSNPGRSKLQNRYLAIQVRIKEQHDKLLEDLLQHRQPGSTKVKIEGYVTLAFSRGLRLKPKGT